MKKITPRQQEILDFIIKFMRSNHYSPSMLEIAEEFGINRNAVFEKVMALQKKGFITTQPNQARTIVLSNPLDQYTTKQLNDEIERRL